MEGRPESGDGAVSAGCCVGAEEMGVDFSCGILRTRRGGERVVGGEVGRDEGMMFRARLIFSVIGDVKARKKCEDGEMRCASPATQVIVNRNSF